MPLPVVVFVLPHLFGAESRIVSIFTRMFHFLSQTVSQCLTKTNYWGYLRISSSGGVSGDGHATP